MTHSIICSNKEIMVACVHVMLLVQSGVFLEGIKKPLV